MQQELQFLLLHSFYSILCRELLGKLSPHEDLREYVKSIQKNGINNPKYKKEFFILN